MRLPQQNTQLSIFSVQSPFAALLLLALLPATVVYAAQVTSSPTTLHFGSIVIGQSETLPASLTNTESTSITISAMKSTSSEFSISGLNLPLVLAAGQTVTFNVTFAPTTGGWEGGSFIFTSNASTPTIYLRIGGVGVSSESMTSNTSSLGFGSVATGSSSTSPVVLTNSGSSGLVLAQVLVAGTGFSVTGPTLPLTLPPNQSATFNVTFNPKSAASFTGSLYVPNGSLTIPLSGTGTTSSQLVLNPTALSFGNVDIGTTSTQPITLSASGGPVTITSSATSSSQFALQGASFPITIPSGQSVSLTVGFTPNGDGNTNGTLSLTSNASNPGAQESLSGVGVTPNVTVSWNASTSQVAGYNVYRGIAPGTYSRLNSTLNSGTTYTDTTVAPGQTYYYAATAVNSTGEESAYSEPVQAVIP